MINSSNAEISERLRFPHRFFLSRKIPQTAQTANMLTIPQTKPNTNIMTLKPSNADVERLVALCGIGYTEVRTSASQIHERLLHQKATWTHRSRARPRRRH